MARALPVLGLDPEDTIQANAALILPVRAAELLAWESFIHDPLRVYELHQMRIAAKRLRYTMELFAPFYGAEFEKAIDRIKAIQEHLGHIHDADVLVPELSAQLRKLLKPGKKTIAGVYGTDFDAASGLLALCRLKRQERETLYGEFQAMWGALRSGGFFESLRRMVLEEALRKQGSAIPSTSGNIVSEGGRNGTRKASHRRTARSERRQSVGDDHTGTGDHPGAVADEGGLGQHSLFEEGDPR